MKYKKVKCIICGKEINTILKQTGANTYKVKISETYSDEGVNWTEDFKEKRKYHEGRPYYWFCNSCWELIISFKFNKLVKD